MSLFHWIWFGLCVRCGCPPPCNHCSKQSDNQSRTRPSLICGDDQPSTSSEANVQFCWLKSCYWFLIHVAGKQKVLTWAFVIAFYFLSAVRCPSNWFLSHHRSSYLWGEAPELFTKLVEFKSDSGGRDLWSNRFEAEGIFKIWTFRSWSQKYFCAQCKVIYQLEMTTPIGWIERWLEISNPIWK